MAIRDAGAATRVRSRASCGHGTDWLPGSTRGATCKLSCLHDLTSSVRAYVCLHVDYLVMISLVLKTSIYIYIDNICI